MMNFLTSVQYTPVIAIKSVAEISHSPAVHQAKANTKMILLFYNWDLWVAGCWDVMAFVEMF